MTENKFNPDAAKRLYEEATSIGTSKVSENDFYNSLNDSEYARIVYNRYKDKYGVNLLGAEDDSSFLSTLGYNVPYAGNKTKEQEPKFSLKRPEEPKKENKVETPESFNTRIPNIQTVKDDVTGEDVSVDMDIPKTPDMTVKMPNSLDRFKQSPLGESNLSKRIFGVDSILEQESPQEKAWKEVYNSAPEAMANLGKDEVEEIYDANGEIIGEKVIRTANEADLDRIQQIQQGIKDQYDAIDKAEGEFIKQYEEYLNNSKVNEVNSHRDEWNLVNPWERRKSNQEMEFLKQNSARYNKIMSAKKALNLQSKFAQTYADLAEYDRSVEKGEQMSAMVSSGEITEDAMKILRATKSPEASRQYIERQVKNGTMSRDTANKLLKMGDLSEKNAFGYGFTHPGYAEDFLTFGMSEIKRNFDIKSINDRLKAGKEVSDDEKNALLMFSQMGRMMDEEKMGKRGWMFEAGQGLPKTLQFIAEIGLTGGTTAIGKGLTRKVITESLKRYGLKRTGAMIAKHTAKRLGKNLGMQAILSPVTPTSYVDYSNRVLNLSLEQENISWEDRVKELYKSYAATTAGRFSETLDNVLFDMPLGSWLYGSKALRPVMVPAIRIAKAFDKLPLSKQTSDLLERFGIDGIHKEILTEMSDPVLQAAFTGDTEELKKMWADKEDFVKTVALHSAILGGFHGAMGYGVDAAKAAIESQRVSKAYDDAMNRIKVMTFVDKQLNELKDELITAIRRNNYVAQDGKDRGRTVGEILSDMDKRMQYYATTDKGTAAYEADKRVFDLADYASRVGAYKFGENQSIKDQVARRMGVAKTVTGGTIPMEFEHTDGNVHEFTDIDGKNYFILDGTDDTVVLIDRATGEKIVKNKSFTDIGTTTVTDANQWAMNEYLMNVDNWKAQDSQAQNQQAQQPGATVPPTQAMLRGVPVPITNFDAQTGEITVTDQTGDELTMPINTPGLELVYPNQQTEQTPVQQEENLQPTEEEDIPAEEPVAPTEETVEAEMQEPAYVAPRGEDNDIVWNEVPAERFKQVIDEEVGSDYADGYIDMRIEDAQRKLNEHNEKQKPIASGEYKAFMEESKKLESNLAYWTNAKQEYANAVAQEVAAQNEVETPAQEEANEVAPESTVMYDAKQPEQVEAEAPVQVSKEELDANVTGWKSNGINVNVVNSIDEVTNEQVLADMKKGVKVTGWYDTKTGEVYVFAPNITDTAELDSTVIHEVVAHKGLRGLIGEKYYEQFCEKVFDSMPKELQDKYMAYPGVNGRKAAAADEYIAYLAEKEDLTAEEQKFWDRIIQFFRDMFDARLVGILKKDTITDADISKLIRMSYANIKNNAQQEADTAVESQSPNEEVADNGVVFENDTNGQAMYSIKTYREGGRDNLVNFAQKQVESNKLTQEQAEEIVSEMDSIYEMIQQYKDVYQPFGVWSEAEVKVDDNGKAVFSVVKPNGEYDMNIDFSLVCKKRRTLDSVFDEMIKRGIISEFELGQVDVAKINEIIREFGFETACRLCFVDAKRFRVAQVADQFCAKYNELVVMNDKQLKQVIKTEEKNSVRKKIAKHLLDHPEDKVILSRDNFMSANGFENIKVNKAAVMSLYNQAKGTGGPKASFGDVQYLNEIADSSWTPEKAYAVGGVRLQSFSDYVPRMVFDYIQMVADLAAKKLPVHSYTKESTFAKQFGLTGIKINMSLVPRVDADGVAPGLDKDGNYTWQEGETFPFDEAIAIQNAEGYKDNCGTIAVGISDEHILKMLDDENIRMVIPYHKSGLNKEVAKFNNIDQFVDYTNSQNTRYADGKKLNKADSKKHFNFNEDLHKNNDPRGAAQRYLEWCDEKGYIPKFEQFRNHPNYYKLLEDFTTVVTESGVDTVVPQRAVEMKFPKETDAFGSLETLIQQGLEEDAVLEGRRSEKIGEIVDRIEETLPKNNPTDPNGGPRYRTSAEIDKEYPNWLEGTTNESGKHSTQVTKTVGTYNKVGEWIENNLGKDVEILDASSGMGLGTQSLREKGFNIEDVEPYQSEDRKQNNPATYSAYADIEKQYDYIISNAVLNVIPDDWRADVLHNMAARMKNGGKMFINTRKAGEEKSIKDKIELDTPQEVLVKRNGKIASYQKFFTPQELKSWVEQELGDGYTVEVANEKNSGTKGLAAVVVTKNSTSDPNGGVRYKAQNETFNNDLERYKNGEMKSSEMFNLGSPQGAMKLFLPELPIVMRQRVLKKGIEKKHNVDISSLKDMPSYIFEPIFIFKRDENSIGILTEIKDRDGKNVCVAIELNKTIQDGGEFIEVNDIRSFHGRDVENIITPIAQKGTSALKWVDKEKGLSWLSSASQQVQQETVKEDLIYASKVINDFVNPTIEEQKSSETRYRIPSTPAEARQRAENIMKDAIAPMARELGVEVNYVTNEDISDVEPGARKKRQSKGWYQDGKVYINLSTHETIDDAKETYLHEVVAHYGLRGLLKEQFEPVMQKVFASLTPTQQQSLLEIFADEVEAAEEFLASMAENDIDPTIVEKVIGFIREALRSMGINLDNYTDGDLQYLLWRSKNSLKENAGNIETARWEAKDAEVRYRTIKNFRLSENSQYGVMDKKIEEIKDSAWSVKLLQDEIIARGGIIDDTSDAYGQATLMPSRSAYEVNIFNDKFYKPMLKTFSKAAKMLAKRNGISVFDANDTLEDFLYARHAIERNKKIAVDKMISKASEQFANLTKEQRVQLKQIATALYEDAYTGGANNVSVTHNGTDFELSISGVPVKSEFTVAEFDTIKTAIDEWIASNKEVNESGLTDKDAQAIIDNVYVFQSAEMQNALDDLSAKIKECTEFTLDKWLEYGIISKADYNTYKSQYEYYIPLRGWEETSDIDYEEVAGNAYNKAETLVSLNRQARGRKSKAESPLAFISQMATSAVIYGNKNLMKQMAFNMIKNNYDLIQDLAFIEDDDKLTHKTKSEINNHEVQLRKDGRTVRFSFQKNFGVGVAAASAVKGNNIVNITSDIVNASGRATRGISILRTSGNPEFIAVNLIRDLGYGNLSYFIKNGLGSTLKLNKNYAIGFGCALLDAIGVPVGSNKLRQEYEAYKREGGQTGYIHMDDIDRLKRETAKIQRRYQNGWGFIPQDIFKPISYALRVLGEPTENAMRFAAFKTMKDNGASEREAAKAAKEITVNFNRTGTVKWPGMLYGFYNATLEGTANYFRMGFDKKTALRFWTANTALMALSYAMNWWAKGFGDDDDDEMTADMTPEQLAEYKQMKEFANEYNRISDYVKHTNALIPCFGDTGDEKKFIAIPLPQSYRMANALGTTLFDIMSNDKDIDDELKEFAWFVIGEVQPFDIENISFDDGKGLISNIGRAASPTVVLPLTEVSQNRNFMGLPIYKEPFINGSKQERIEPSYKLASKNAPQILIAASKELNEMLGGTDRVSAEKSIEYAQNRQDAEGFDYRLAQMVDAMDPSSVNHVLQGWFAGLYEIPRTLVEMYNNDDVAMEDYIFMRRFLKSATQKPGYEEYFEYMEFADQAKRIRNIGRAHAQNGEANQPTNDDRYKDKLIEANDYWKKRIKEVTDKISAYKEGDVVDEAKIKNLEERRDSLILQAALSFKRIERKYIGQQQ